MNAMWCVCAPHLGLTSPFCRICCVGCPGCGVDTFTAGQPRSAPHSILGVNDSHVGYSATEATKCIALATCHPRHEVIFTHWTMTHFVFSVCFSGSMAHHRRLPCHSVNTWRLLP